VRQLAVGVVCRATRRGGADAEEVEAEATRCRLHRAAATGRDARADGRAGGDRARVPRNRGSNQRRTFRCLCLLLPSKRRWSHRADVTRWHTAALVIEPAIAAANSRHSTRRALGRARR